MRRKLIYFTPIEWIAAVHDGVIVNHPAWFPVQVRATPEAWKYHKDEIHMYLFGKEQVKK
jgi:hypothetical protein